MQPRPAGRPPSPNDLDMLIVADISPADLATAAGGTLTILGSILALLALLDRPGKQALTSVAVALLGLGAVLLFWPIAEERGLVVYWAILGGVGATALGLTAWLRFTPQGREELSKFNEKHGKSHDDAKDADGDEVHRHG